MRGPPVADGRVRLTRGIFEAGRLREVDAGWCVGLEWTPQAELFADIPQRRPDLLAEQANPRLRVLPRDEAVGGPEADHRVPPRLQHAPQPQNGRLRHRRDD